MKTSSSATVVQLTVILKGFGGSAQHSASRMVLSTALQQGTALGWTADVAEPFAVGALRRRPAKRLQQLAWRQSPQKRCRHQVCWAAVVTEQSEVCRCVQSWASYKGSVPQPSTQTFDKATVEQADRGCRHRFCWPLASLVVVAQALGNDSSHTHIGACLKAVS